MQVVTRFDAVEAIQPRIPRVKSIMKMGSNHVVTIETPYGERRSDGTFEFQEKVRMTVHTENEILCVDDLVKELLAGKPFRASLIMKSDHRKIVARIPSEQALAAIREYFA